MKDSRDGCSMVKPGYVASFDRTEEKPCPRASYSGGTEGCGENPENWGEVAPASNKRIMEGGVVWETCDM